MKSSRPERDVHVLDVHLENVSNNNGVDPIKRLIRVHARSIAKARKSHQCGDCNPSATDSMQCRIVVNALRREIDRLMRGVDRYDICRREPCVLNNRYSPNGPNGSDSDRRPTDSALRASAAETSRRMYAVAPIGDAFAPPTLAFSAPTNDPSATTQGAASASINLLA